MSAGGDFLVRRNRFDAVGQSLVFAAGVIVALVFVSIMILEFENSRRLSDTVNGRMTEMTASVRDSGVMMYDGVKVLGADVLNFGKKHFYAVSGSGPFELMITTRQGQTVLINNRDDMEAAVAASALGTDPGSVGPTEEFLGSVEQNDNGMITAVKFTYV